MRRRHLVSDDDQIAVPLLSRAGYSAPCRLRSWAIGLLLLVLCLLVIWTEAVLCGLTETGKLTVNRLFSRSHLHRPGKLLLVVPDLCRSI